MPGTVLGTDDRIINKIENTSVLNDILFIWPTWSNHDVYTYKQRDNINGDKINREYITKSTDYKLGTWN